MAETVSVRGGKVTGISSEIKKFLEQEENRKDSRIRSVGQQLRELKDRVTVSSSAAASDGSENASFPLAMGLNEDLGACVASNLADEGCSGDVVVFAARYKRETSSRSNGDKNWDELSGFGETFGWFVG